MSAWDASYFPSEENFPFKHLPTTPNAHVYMHTLRLSKIVQFCQYFLTFVLPQESDNAESFTLDGGPMDNLWLMSDDTIFLR